MSLKLHNADWPGGVGKDNDDPDQENRVSTERMIALTSGVNVSGMKYDGMDLAVNPNWKPRDIAELAELLTKEGFELGTLVAAVWSDIGGGSAMRPDQQAAFLAAVTKACEAAVAFQEAGVRGKGENVIRIDSAEFGVEAWRQSPVENTKQIADTFRQAAKIAADKGQRLAAEGEICWAGQHSWKDMLDLLEEVDMQDVLGFQADLAHTYLYLLGYNAPEHALLKYGRLADGDEREGYTSIEFYNAYEKMTKKLRPWTIDFHVAQNDGTVHGAGTHDKTGRHCRANDPRGRLDITRCSQYWLKDAEERGIQHICWDGCMFPNAWLEEEQTWTTILDAMIKVRDAN